MKKLLILLAALALSFTLASAEGKCGAEGNKTMKCEAGKCAGADKKDMQKKGTDVKCDSSAKEPKEVPKEVKCGQGKCGQ